MLPERVKANLSLPKEDNSPDLPEVKMPSILELVMSKASMFLLPSAMRKHSSRSALRRVAMPCT